MAYTAVILAGGRASRLGGVAKPLVEVGGRTLLDAALSAAAGAREVVVVGEVPVPAGVLQVVEDPPRSGPAAGLAAGVRALSEDAPWTLVLASDVPGVEQAVPTLVASAEDDLDSDGVCFHDESGHPQWMLGLYRSPRLRGRIEGVESTDLSLRRLLAPLLVRTIAGDPAAIADCDTWDDVEAARARSSEAAVGMASTRSSDEIG
ncbi:MAG: NTP transferase domain-containing protein [Actinomycetales bacterium]|nr:NTP transferase domain-containing protein [Actinomycetales bacterium]